MKIEDDLLIERAHRVGKPRPPYRHVGGSKVASKPWSIVARFQIWKEKEKVIRAARKSKPDRVQFFEDFAKTTLERRRQKVPELIKARKQGKKHFSLWTGLFMQNRGLPMKVNLLMSIISLALQVHSEILNCLMSDHKLLLNNLIYLVHSFITAISPFVCSFKYFCVLP